MAQGNARPNIVWIVVEDMPCHFSFQGEKMIATPNVDRLAAEDDVFDRAYINLWPNRLIDDAAKSESERLTWTYNPTKSRMNYCLPDLSSRLYRAS